MSDEGDVYRRLQKHLDALPIAYPATESGVELRILMRLFTDRRRARDAAPVTECETLDEAVRRARAAAGRGQWVLLAPACASYDQFSGYAERGRRFAELARSEVARCR